MRALLIDVTQGKSSVVNVKDFHDIQAKLKVDAFDIVARRIGNNRNAIYDIYCDDCGLLKGNPIVSAYDTKGVPHLVGNLLITKHEHGDLISLTDEDLQYLERWCVELIDTKTGEPHVALLIVDYPV